MSHQEDKIRKLLHEKLEGVHTSPPEQIWDGIENELFPKKKKRPFIWFFSAAMLIGGISIYIALLNPNSLESSTTNDPKTTAHIQNNKTQSFENSTLNSDKVDSTDSKHLSTENNQSYQSKLNGSNTIKPRLKTNNNDFKKTNVNNKSGNLATNTKLNEQINTTANLNPPIDIQNGLNSKNEELTNSLVDIKFQHEIKSSFDEVRQYNNSNEDSIKNIAKQKNEVLVSNDSLQTPKKAENPSTIQTANSAKHFLLLSASLGREIRNYQFNDGLTSNYPNLVDRDVAMRYRGLGVSYQNQFKPSWAWSIGLLTHRNRFITRLFPIQIANEKLNDAYEFNTSAGELKSSPLNLSEFANTNQDTTVFLGRIIHRSAFLSIPLAIRWNTNNKKTVNFYIQAGFQVNIKMRERNTIVIRNTAFERSFETQKLKSRQLLAPSGAISLGISSSNQKRLQWFGELTYAQYLGNFHKGENLTITSKNVYLSLGLRKSLK